MSENITQNKKEEEQKKEENIQPIKLEDKKENTQTTTEEKKNEEINTKIEEKKDEPVKIEEKKVEEPPKELTPLQRIRGKQTNPPTIPVGKLFSAGIFPLGEIQEYSGGNTFRKTSKEMREKERLLFNTYNMAREAAEVHRQVRAFAHQIIKPGIKLYDMCEQLENLNRKLVQEKGLERGIAFPTGCSLNHIAAHYSPNPCQQDKEVVFGYDDVMKVDFGVQINGTIIDCAWTVAPNPKFNPLLETVRNATNTGIKHAGIDARLNEIGEAIQEVMESGEIELNGKIYPIRSVRNLNGHNIGPYRIHGGKSVPIIKGGEQVKMEEGEFYAIETFGSTGKGFVREDYDCSHYMKNFDAPFTTIRNQSTKKLFSHITKHYSTLAFCKRWLERDGLEKYAGSLKQLCDLGLVNAYPPLCDVKGSYVAQFEHTILLKPTCKEVLSRGDDY